MKPSQILLFGVFPASIYGWKRFTPSAVEVPSIVNHVSPSPSSPLELNPSRFLEDTGQKPGFYAAAMLEIKRLEEKPVCHRMAAQLLVKNCQGLKDMGVQEYQAASESMQRHHVESFAASLAMCDMDRARFDIPDACKPFRSHALETAIHTTGKLDVTADDVSDCLQGLGQDHSHWSTWLSYRDTSLLLCRGASLDVEKDQAIKFQKQFVKMMEDFTTSLYDDLRNLRRQMASYTQESTTLFEESKKQADSFTVKMQETFESVTEEIMNANLGVKSIVDGTNDAYRMIRNLVSTMVQSNAEMAAEQENAIAVTTNNLKSSLGGINDLVTENEGRLVNMQDVVNLMATTVNNLVERQNAIEESSIKTLNALINATELVQSHEHKLNEASLKATKISDDLEKVVANTYRLGSWGASLDWVIRTVVPIITLFGGNFRTVPTTGNNLLLLAIGYALGETINIIRYIEWECFWAMYFPTWVAESYLDEEHTASPSSMEEPIWKGRIIMPKISPSQTTAKSEPHDGYEMV